MIHAFFAAVALVAAAASSSAAPATGAVEAVVQAAAARGEFSGVVRLTRPGAQPVVISVGEADRGAHAKITPATRFRLASLTKTVTAVLVLKAVDEGRLSLDAPVGDKLADLPPTVKRVTPRQLLQHTSGLANPSDGVADDVVPPFYARIGKGSGDHQAAARGACSAAPKAEAGKGFSYNNCDYILLGALLERLYGLPYARLVEEKISRPLGLSWRIAPEAPTTADRVAKGYGADGKEELFQNPATYGASGALIGTVEDVARFDAALMDGRLLSPARLAELTTADPKLYGEALSVWAYDVDLGGGRKVHVWERQGDIGGTRLLNLFIPAEHASLVIAANTEKADLFDTYSKKGLGYALLAAAFSSPPSP